MQPTRDTSTLDLIFFDMAEYYEIPAILTSLSTSDHNVINWKSKCNIAGKENLTKIKVRQFQQQQLEQFDALLANYNWSSVFNTSGIDRKVNTFFTENITEYNTNYWKYDFWIFSEKTVRIYSKDKPFMTSKIKRLILKRNMAFKNKKVELVRSLRKRITAEIPRAKMSFY